MPTELLPLGVSTPLLQGVVYALPATAVIIHSNDAVETSLASTGPWTLLPTGNKTTAAFVRCTTANTLVTLGSAPKGSSVGGAPITFTYYSPVAVNGSGQVASSQTNFPMLVSYTDARFKSVSNGGHVSHISGFDIRPYDAVGGSPLTFELEYYNPTTGQVIMWVSIPTIVGTTIIYLYYGHAGIVSDGSSPNTWNANYKGVWHLGNGGVLNALDSTSNAANGTVTNVTAATGKIGGGGSFNGVSSLINVGAGSHLDDLTPVTFSAWIQANLAGAGGSERVFDKTGTLLFGFSIFVGPATVGTSIKFFQYFNAGATLATWGSPNSSIKTDGSRQYVVVVYNRSSAANDPLFYIDGVLVATTETVAPVGSATTDVGKSLYIGNRSDATRPWDGMLDELRVSNIARAASWIQTEYNNQNAPSTFASLNTEVAL